MHKGSTAHSLCVGLCVSLWSLIMKSNTVQSLNMLSHRPLFAIHKLMPSMQILQLKCIWMLADFCVHWNKWRMSQITKRNTHHGGCERGSTFEKKQREELSSAAVAKGGLALTNPFFFDLFIQMKEQNEAGLCRTIALSPQTLTWSAFTRALIIFNYAHFLTSCNSYTAGLKLSGCPSAPLQPPFFVLLSFSSPDSMPVVSADKLNGPELQLVV